MYAGLIIGRVRLKKSPSSRVRFDELIYRGGVTRNCVMIGHGIFAVLYKHVRPSPTLQISLISTLSTLRTLSPALRYRLILAENAPPTYLLARRLPRIFGVQSERARAASRQSGRADICCCRDWSQTQKNRFRYRNCLQILEPNPKNRNRYFE